MDVLYSTMCRAETIVPSAKEDAMSASPCVPKRSIKATVEKSRNEVLPVHAGMLVAFGSGHDLTIGFDGGVRDLMEHGSTERIQGKRLLLHVLSERRCSGRNQAW
ncbi:hypothetical protein PUNSTDRAFT_49942 [Punctularia strigosozonata HHB-11173 SS5]|uniref:uncharacterized protein n=1 Tax=Punctularia strigosozonata (strain HHB-11173) TaxID=741275 RepID=UPI0004417C70|nr:uncharacterized protein PUNSTDRAFT_49942 [Punctularia strigosozonata HHB-11173 SS5]EIN12654.1 hypothetical protein PUNSTDRAFT_49942 [Punctularia strigosozonata HHB-11173 SS5]